MSYCKIITKATFAPCVGEVNDKKKFGYYTESAGYIPANRMIEGMLYAGERLAAARAEMYDTDDEDPILEKSYDVRDMELSEIGAVMNQLDLKPIVLPSDEPSSPEVSDPKE